MLDAISYIRTALNQCRRFPSELKKAECFVAFVRMTSPKRLYLSLSIQGVSFTTGGRRRRRKTELVFLANRNASHYSVQHLYHNSCKNYLVGKNLSDNSSFDFNCRPVSSVGRASHYCTGGLGFEPQTGPTQGLKITEENMLPLQ